MYMMYRKRKQLTPGMEFARGDYLQAGIAKVKKGTQSGYARASGSTLAHFACDRLYVRIYLDESANGTDGWGTLNYWDRKCI